jgi:hypothetical protein
MSLSNVRELDLCILVYVSRSELSIDGDIASVEEIVAVANARNAQLRVTGGLVYTETHFAQILEGPKAAIAELMTSIGRDQRHCDVTVVAEHRIAARRFPEWAMAYSGPSPFLDRHLKPLIAPRLSDKGRQELVELLITSIKRLQAERA